MVSFSVGTLLGLGASFFFSYKNSWLLVPNIAAFGYVLGIVAREHLVVPLMLLPSTVLGKWQATSIENMKKKAFRDDEAFAPVQLTTSDNVKLDAVEWINPRTSDNKWILWMNPNGVLYEQIMTFIAAYGAAVGASVLAFNYRGVGRSEGPLRTATEIVKDGLAAMEYLINVKKASPSDILIHGFSMGGGVGSQVRALYPNGPIINDRSFGSLKSEVIALFGKVLGPVATQILHLWDWDLDSAEAWNRVTGRKLVVFHSKDGIILNAASLYTQLKQQNLIQEHNETSVQHILQRIDGESIFNRAAVSSSSAPSSETRALQLGLKFFFPLETSPQGQSTNDTNDQNNTGDLIPALDEDEARRKRRVPSEIPLAELSAHQMYHCYPLNYNSLEWKIFVDAARWCLYGDQQ